MKQLAKIITIAGIEYFRPGCRGLITPPGRVRRAVTLIAVSFLFLASSQPARAASTCEPGCYPVGATCMPCPPGTFAATGGSLVCTPCPTGQTGNLATGSTSCVAYRTLRSGAGHSAKLRPTRNTSPSLAIRADSVIYWGDLSTVLVSGSFRINHAGTIYSVTEPIGKPAGECGESGMGEFRVTLNNMPANSLFSFTIGASGTFTIDWGNGAPITVIERTQPGSIRYTSPVAYAGGGPYTLKITGRATGYSAALGSWGENRNSAIGFNHGLLPTRITALYGDLGTIFPVLGAGPALTPRFDLSFAYLSLPFTIPDNMFASVQGAPVPNMFSALFEGSRGLTRIPPNLFSGIQGPPASNLFAFAFHGTRQAEIPGGLFSGIVGPPAAGMFWSTFNENPNLTSIGQGLFDGISGSLAGNAFVNTFANAINLSGPSATSDGQFLYEKWPNATVAQIGGAYAGATRLSDWANIPANWR